MSSIEMSKREEALGYPSSDTRGGRDDTSFKFSLPSITLPPIRDMQLPRPDYTPNQAPKHDLFGLGSEGREFTFESTRVVDKGKGKGKEKEVDSTIAGKQPSK
jgi:hypothetical protein